MVRDRTSRNRLTGAAPLFLDARVRDGVTSGKYLCAVQGQSRASVIITVYNQVAFTRICLASLALLTDPGTEVLVVDNGSTDGTSEFLRDWERESSGHRVIRPGRNLGFARGCNRGAADAQGEYLVFLNNDTFVLPGWLSGLIAPLVDAQARISGSRLLYPNGRIQHAGLAFDERGPHHIFAGLVADHPCVVEARDWQAVTGASLAISRSDFDSIRGFDEGYLNSFEDVDLCLRARQRGWRVRYVPESAAYHFEGMTEGRQGPSDRRNYEVFINRWRGRFETDLGPALEAARAAGFDLRDRIPPKVELRAALDEARQRLTTMEVEVARLRDEVDRDRAEAAGRQSSRLSRRVARRMGLGAVRRRLRAWRRASSVDS